jgi:predicted nucleotidyltransferase component of viral defense system
MHDAIKQMLTKYQCRSQQDYINALKEIFQEIALLGLWRAKFFERAAFYGGSALRILYGLDRFSEDLDFSLLKKSPDFDLTPYNKAVTKELAAFGFAASVETKNKQLLSNIESAFIKAESKKQLLVIEAPQDMVKSVRRMQTIKIKMEVDINPPGLFSTETKFLLHPIPFSLRSFIKPDLFAGKIHALLCRPWVTRVKGRDWYDFLWHLSQNIPVNLLHLKERMIQSQVWDRRKILSKNSLIELLLQKIKETDFNAAKNDISPFVKKSSSLEVWSKDFFKDILKQIKTIN